MSISCAQVAPLPAILKLGARVLLASVLVLGGLQACERALIAPLIPAFRGMISLLDLRFRVISVDLVREGSDTVLRFDANLARPIQYAGHTLYPLGWNGQADGVFQAQVGGVLQYSALLLIVVLAWPLQRWRELPVRLACAAPLLVLLPLIATPTIVIAELWNVISHEFAPEHFVTWMVWNRFLAGGGGLVLALLAAALSIGLGRRLSSARAVRQATPSDPRPAPAPPPAPSRRSRRRRDSRAPRPARGS